MLGETLKKHRLFYGYTQKEIADKIKIKQQSISQWETNKSEPLISNCIALADLYNISLDELVDREIKKNW